jgi:hypothetical protein
MKINENLKQKLARALRAKAQPIKNQAAYAGADIAIQACYDETLEQLHGVEQLYGDDACGEYHPYFNNRNARDPFYECR